MILSKLKINLLKQKPALYKNSSSAGSVSMEYIIVSCFALLISVTAVSWLGKIIKDRINKIAERMNLDTADLELDFDNDFATGD